jgi:uncharacterized membrane protein (UPF0136 family)
MVVGRLVQSRKSTPAVVLMSSRLAFVIYAVVVSVVLLMLSAPRLSARNFAARVAIS